MEEAKELLEIIRCFIDNADYPRQENVDEEKLYKLAKKHSVSNFLQDWATRYCKNEKVKNDIFADYNLQILRDTNENVELENILNKFEEAQIKTLIVKGVLMKEAYPKSYMRQMCDIDIMVQEKDLKKACKIMRGLNYNEFYDHEKHFVYTKEPFSVVEVHRKLIPGGDVSSEYFNNIWPLCIKYQNYENVYRMDIDDVYVFCIIHLMRHFQYAGAEIKNILDVYLYYEKFKDKFDYDKLNKKFEEFGVTEFEANIRKIAYKWFGGHPEDFDDIEKFILKGQSIENFINYSVGKRQGKGLYIFRLFFPEFKIMKEKYPILKKAPILYPVTWCARILKCIFSKEDGVKDKLYTLKLVQDANLDEVKNIQEIYEKLGIKGERK